VFEMVCDNVSICSVRGKDNAALACVDLDLMDSWDDMYKEEPH